MVIFHVESRQFSKLIGKNPSKEIDGILLVARALEIKFEFILNEAPPEVIINILLIARTLVQEVAEVGIVTRDNRLGTTVDGLEEQSGTWSWTSTRKPVIAEGQLEVILDIRIGQISIEIVVIGWRASIEETHINPLIKRIGIRRNVEILRARVPVPEPVNARKCDDDMRHSHHG
jgi:hypothetical protein